MRAWTTNRAGFTLIELSVVLVVIGLIVGGVLAGQDLIRAASVRATISQIDKLNVAVNVFRDKYKDNLPGDMSAADAASFGFLTRPGTVGAGDGNGILQVCGSNSNIGFYFGCETEMFWVDLAGAGLIEGSFNTSQASYSMNNNTDTWAGSSIAPYLPSAKMGTGNYIAVISGKGSNYFALAQITSLNGVYGAQGNLTPLVAQSIDTKMDDGVPLTGNVQAADICASCGGSNWLSGSFTPSTGTSAANCISNPAGPFVNTYNNLGTSGTTPACQLAFKFQ
ncbi:MAG TPA: prepilin-type N-terminal cleavage/methylation domain-containing protein [Bryobacteraceae bacterium]|nr:prepilin-type N-terminal cleavage/methylation domain-containing protein [Bryobacteraceae bacterium]